MKALVLFEDEKDFEFACNSMIGRGLNFKIIPGNLLASFEGLVHKFDLSEIQSGDRQGLIISGVGLSEENYQPVRVLILGEK